MIEVLTEALENNFTVIKESNKYECDGVNYEGHMISTIFHDTLDQAIEEIVDRLQNKNYTTIYMPRVPDSNIIGTKGKYKIILLCYTKS